MLSALLRAGRSLTVGLFCLSTADSILMSYQKLDIREEEYDCEPEQAPVVGGHYVQFTSLHYV
jgi:hypothetical protein